MQYLENLPSKAYNLVIKLVDSDGSKTTADIDKRIDDLQKEKDALLKIWNGNQYKRLKDDQRHQIANRAINPGNSIDSEISSLKDYKNRVKNSKKTKFEDVSSIALEAANKLSDATGRADKEANAADDAAKQIEGMMKNACPEANLKKWLDQAKQAAQNARVEAEGAQADAREVSNGLSNLATRIASIANSKDVSEDQKMQIVINLALEVMDTSSSGITSSINAHIYNSAAQRALAAAILELSKCNKCPETPEPEFKWRSPETGECVECQKCQDGFTRAPQGTPENGKGYVPPIEGRPEVAGLGVSPGSSTEGSQIQINVDVKNSENAETVTTTVTGPNGETTTVVLSDDGNHGDGEAGDGKYGGVFDSSGKSTGEYTVGVSVEGTDGSHTYKTSSNINGLDTFTINCKGEHVAPKPRITLTADEKTKIGEYNKLADELTNLVGQREQLQEEWRSNEKTKRSIESDTSKTDSQKKSETAAIDEKQKNIVENKLNSIGSQIASKKTKLESLEKDLESVKQKVEQAQSAQQSQKSALPLQSDYQTKNPGSYNSDTKTVNGANIEFKEGESEASTQEETGQTPEECAASAESTTEQPEIQPPSLEIVKGILSKYDGKNAKDLITRLSEEKKKTVDSESKEIFNGAITLLSELKDSKFASEVLTQSILDGTFIDFGYSLMLYDPSQTKSNIVIKTTDQTFDLDRETTKITESELTIAEATGTYNPEFSEYSTDKCAEELRSAKERIETQKKTIREELDTIKSLTDEINNIKEDWSITSAAKYINYFGESFGKSREQKIKELESQIADSKRRLDALVNGNFGLKKTVEKRTKLLHECSSETKTVNAYLLSSAGLINDNDALNTLNQAPTTSIEQQQATEFKKQILANSIEEKKKGESKLETEQWGIYSEKVGEYNSYWSFASWGSWKVQRSWFGQRVLGTEGKDTATYEIEKAETRALSHRDNQIHLDVLQHVLKKSLNENCLEGLKSLTVQQIENMLSDFEIDQSAKDKASEMRSRIADPGSDKRAIALDFYTFLRSDDSLLAEFNEKCKGLWTSERQAQEYMKAADRETSSVRAYQYYTSVMSLVPKDSEMWKKAKEKASVLEQGSLFGQLGSAAYELVTWDTENPKAIEDILNGNINWRLTPSEISLEQYGAMITDVGTDPTNLLMGVPAAVRASQVLPSLSVVG